MRALIFSHFSRTNALSSHVLETLTQYQTHTDEIVFVSTSPLPRAGHDQVNLLCSHVIERDNVGYDFMSWKTGLDALPGLDHADEIIIANDSVLGPLGQTDRLFSRLRKDTREVCGLTLSWEQARHVQSYFVRFSRATLRSGAFHDFWRGVTPLHDKQHVIDRYELQLSSFMEQRGHTTGALFEAPRGFTVMDRTKRWTKHVDLRHPVKALRSLRRSLDLKDLNPTIDLWRECLDAGIPFVKKELIRDNPPGVSIEGVTTELARRFTVDPDAIRKWSRT
ncbi:MAG: rhamnan synthesis F family protein [Pseudomonadota bacterium]